MIFSINLIIYLLYDIYKKNFLIKIMANIFENLEKYF